MNDSQYTCEDWCVTLAIKTHKHIVFSMGFFVLFWDCAVLLWDSKVWALGFIWCVFSQWDFTVPEVNIYYYMPSGLPPGSRIPADHDTLDLNR